MRNLQHRTESMFSITIALLRADIQVPSLLLTKERKLGIGGLYGDLVTLLAPNKTHGGFLKYCYYDCNDL